MNLNLITLSITPETTIIILLGLGLDELSMSPTAIPEIKKIVRSVQYAEIRHLANEVLDIATGSEVKHYAEKRAKEILPNFLW